MIISANFKTNHTRQSTKEYLDKLVKINTKHQLRVYPPMSALFKANSPLHVKLGAQNFYPVKSGSFTGEIGEEQLGEFGINSVLIGHSERRNILGENDELIAQKFNFAKERNWEITFCIGEPKSVRDGGKDSVVEYLNNQLLSIDLDYENLIIAYEPVWAIGTGVVAKIEDIKDILDTLRQKSKAPLLYGGSVKPENVSDVFGLDNCDGVLVGTASLDIESFERIINEG